VETKHTAQTILYVGSAVVALLVNACDDRGNDHAATALQRAATAHVADPALCPSGDSRDIQRIVDAAGSAEVISLPEGCYRMTSTINLPPGRRLVGTGATLEAKKIP
jgi:hypothetical protein